MENIETILIGLTIVAIILTFLLPFMLWLFNIVDKSKLSKVNTFEEFRKRMKIMAIRKWLKPGVTLTNEEIRKEVIKEIEGKEKLFKKLTRWLQFPFYLFYFTIFFKLSHTILRYYITIKTGYEFPLKFPIADVLLLIGLSLLISVFLTTKLGIYRINMFLKKLNELEDKTS